MSQVPTIDPLEAALDARFDEAQGAAAPDPLDTLLDQHFTEKTGRPTPIPAPEANPYSDAMGYGQPSAPSPAGMFRGAPGQPGQSIPSDLDFAGNPAAAPITRPITPQQQTAQIHAYYQRLDPSVTVPEALAMHGARQKVLSEGSFIGGPAQGPTPGSVLSQEADTLTGMRARDAREGARAEEAAGQSAGYLGRAAAAGLGGLVHGMEQPAATMKAMEGYGIIPPGSAPNVTPDTAGAMYGLKPGEAEGIQAVGAQADPVTQNIAGLASLPLLPADPAGALALLTTGGLGAKIIAGIEQRAGSIVSRKVAQALASAGEMGSVMAAQTAASYPAWDTDPQGGINAVYDAAGMGGVVGAGFSAGHMALGAPAAIAGKVGDVRAAGVARTVEQGKRAMADAGTAAAQGRAQGATVPAPGSPPLEYIAPPAGTPVPPDSIGGIAVPRDRTPAPQPPSPIQQRAAEEAARTAQLLRAATTPAETPVPAPTPGSTEAPPTLPVQPNRRQLTEQIVKDPGQAPKEPDHVPNVGPVREQQTGESPLRPREEGAAAEEQAAAEVEPSAGRGVVPAEDLSALSIGELKKLAKAAGVDPKQGRAALVEALQGGRESGPADVGHSTEQQALDDYLSKHDATKGQVPAREPYLPARDEAFAAEVNAPGSRRGSDTSLKFGRGESVHEAIATGERLGYRPEDIAAYLRRNYTEGGEAAVPLATANTNPATLSHKDLKAAAVAAGIDPAVGRAEMVRQLRVRSANEPARTDGVPQAELPEVAPEVDKTAPKPDAKRGTAGAGESHPAAESPQGVGRDRSGVVVDPVGQGVSPGLSGRDRVGAVGSGVEVHAEKSTPAKPSTLSLAALRAELESAGVEVAKGTSRKDLVSGVENLRAGRVEPAETRSNPPEPAAAEKPVEAKADDAEPHKFSSTQADLPPDLAAKVKQAAAKIPDADLAPDGREDTPHVTVKYGLHTEDAADVAKTLEGQGPITVKLGKVSLFENPEHDVVKVDVDSPDLHALNKRIADALPHTDTHPDYKPHVTLAYVKKGLGKKYVGGRSLSGETTTIDRIAFSDKSGKVTEIRLGGEKVAAEPAPEPTKGETKPTTPAATESVADAPTRPAKASTYAENPKARAWEVLEPDWHRHDTERSIRAYERGIEAKKAELAKMSPRAYAERRRAEDAIAAWGQMVERWKKRLVDPATDTGAGKREEYVKLVKEAISKGEQVPQEVIDQHPEFTKAVDARARYDKGRHTSFANKSVAVDSTMQSGRGYKVKRQDGTPITDAQKAEVDKAIADIEEAIGPIGDLMRKSDLTIAHTSGKFPFMNSTAGGLYHPSERTVTVGTVIGPFVQRAHAHEIGHWLDFEAGSERNLSTRLRSKSNKGYDSPSTAEAANRAWGDLAKDPNLQAERDLIQKAIPTINDVVSVRRILGADPEKLTPDQKVEQQVEKFRLTPYWREPREVWARLFEQYIANKLERGGPGHEKPAVYAKMPGWWTQAEFNKLRPDIEKIIESKVRALRGGDAPAAGGMLQAIADAAEKAAAKAAERIKNRATPRGGRTGGGTILEDTIDTGILVGAKLVQFGAKRAGQMAKTISAVLKEIGRPDLAKYTADIARVARRIVRQSRGEDGAFAADKFEAAAADAQSRKVPDQPTTKQAIAQSTGAGLKQPKVLTESEAYVRSLRREGRAAGQSYRLGLAEGRNRADVMAQELSQAMRSKVMRATITERAKGEAEVGKLRDQDALRKEALTLAENHVPLDARGPLLRVINEATTPRRLLVAVRRIQDAIANRQMRVGYKDFVSAAKGANPQKMLEEYRVAVRQAKVVAARLKKGSNAAGLTLAEKQSIADEFNELRKIVVEARHRQKADNELTVQGKVAKREAVVASGLDAIQKRPEIKAEEGLPVAQRASLAGRVHQAMLTPDSVGAMFRDPTLRTVLSEDMWDGETHVNRDAQAAMDDLKANVEKAGLKWGSDELQRLSRGVAGKEADVVKVRLASGQKLEATPGELMALYATMTDSGAARNIEAGAGVTFDRNRLGEPYKLEQGDKLKVKLALDQINPALVGIIDRAKQYVEKNVRPGLFDAFREQKGYDLEPVKDYWRTRRNRANQAAPGLLEPMRKHLNRALENLGFLKERTPEGKTPYLVGDFFQDFHDITYQGAVVTHMTRRVRNAELIFKDKRMQEAIQSRFGAGMLRRLDHIIENGKLIFSEPKSGAERFAATLNKNLAKSLLTLNPRTFLKQLGGVFKLGGVMDVADVAAGVKGMYAPEVSAILKSDPYFRNRYQESIFRRMTPSLGERGAQLGQSTVRQAAGRLLTVNPKQLYGAVQDLTDRIELLNNFDAANARVAIAGKLAEAKRLGVADPAKYAAREAQYAIRRTNNTSSPLDMSGLASDLRGGPGSSFLMFTSDSNKSYNMIATAAQHGKKPLTKALAMVALDNAWGAAVSTALGAAGFAAARRLVTGEDKTPREKKKAGVAETFARAFARNAFGAVYGLDNLVEAVGRGVDAASGRGKNDRPVLETPLMSTMEDLMSSIATLTQAVGSSDQHFQSGPREGKNKGAEFGKEGAAQLLDAVSRLGGVPVSPALRMGKTVYREVSGALGGS